MTAQTLLVDDEIEALAKTIPEFTGGVFSGTVPDGADIPTNHQGAIRPYLVLLFGGLIQTKGRYRGITGSRQNLKYHPVTAFAVGGTDRQARYLADRIRDVFEGFQPSIGGGELSEETSGNTRYPGDRTLKPTRYVQMLSFSLLID